MTDCKILKFRIYTTRARIYPYSILFERALVSTLFPSAEDDNLIKNYRKLLNSCEICINFEPYYSDGVLYLRAEVPYDIEFDSYKKVAFKKYFKNLGATDPIAIDESFLTREEEITKWEEKIGFVEEIFPALNDN